MAFKEFCVTMQAFAEKFEEQIKIEINELHNLVSSNSLGEIKSATEGAKNYHYEEIINSLRDIFAYIKKISFHIDQIEWLNDETSVSKDQLKRFSYVQRQIYAFSKNENGEANLESPKRRPLSKKMQRRTSAELSIWSLDAWDNYLNKKEEDEKVVDEQMQHNPKPVIKRKVSNIKSRKNLRSSTAGMFLDEKPDVLESIEEDPSTNDDCSSVDSDNVDLKETDLQQSLDNTNNLDICSIKIGGNTNDENIIIGSNERSSQNIMSNLVVNDNVNVLVRDDDSHGEDTSDKQLSPKSRTSSASVIVRKNQIEKREEKATKSAEDIKPRVVNVIYKKKLNEK